MVVIIDLGISNVASVANIVEKIGGRFKIINHIDQFKSLKPDKLILPGVGSFDTAMSRLHEGGWVDELNNFIKNFDNKILGICLGMQLMFNTSEEGKLEGLGWVDGHLRKFIFQDNKQKIPHMGWNVIDPKKDKKLFKINHSEQRFYFVHSFYAVCVNDDDIAATCNYGHNFTCSIEKENIFGVQFHPEKSHRFGKALFKNFLDI